MVYENRLRELREAKGFSQVELARRINVTPGSVAHWELGMKNISMGNIIALCDLLGCTADQLLGREPPGRTSA
ncbi:helix-turn-helix domain-containing protein [Pseudoflavonifractor sp. P01025]|uniref:helix-turn-helix domain-containing protein n=1 Tax=Flintibacter porci TaxID=3342383 RepID=UPI0035B693CB